MSGCLLAVASYLIDSYVSSIDLLIQLYGKNKQAYFPKSRTIRLRYSCGLCVDGSPMLWCCFVIEKSTIRVQYSVCTVNGLSEMVSNIKGEFYCHSVTTSMTSPGASVSVCMSPSVSDNPPHSSTDTHSLYVRTSQTALSSTCLQCYLPQSLPGSQIPTVSAHVNSKITGHAQTHICFAFERVISACTQAIR